MRPQQVERTCTSTGGSGVSRTTKPVENRAGMDSSTARGPGVTDSIPSQNHSGPISSWTDLVQQLVVRFPQIGSDEVVDIVVRTQRASEAFGIPEGERLEVAEIVARNQLLQLSGEVSSVVRLDPETHRRRDSDPEAPL